MTSEATLIAEWQEGPRGDEHKIVATDIEDHWIVLKLKRRYSIDEWSVEDSWKAQSVPTRKDSIPEVTNDSGER